jgi:hypothetical protein
MWEEREFQSEGTAGIKVWCIQYPSDKSIMHAYRKTMGGTQPQRTTNNMLQNLYFDLQKIVTYGRYLVIVLTQYYVFYKVPKISM